MILAQDVYTWDDTKVPLLAKHAVLTRRMIDMLVGYGLFEVQIVEEDVPLPTPKQIIDEELQDEAIQHLEDLFTMAQQNDESPSAVARVVKQLDTVVEQLISSLMEDQSALVNISDLKSYDEYTYHHSLSVAVLSIAIGQSMGFKAAQLSQLGKCAMMHDIGKTAVPVAIINKPARLDAEEWNVMQTHSSEGYQYLIRNKIGGKEMWGSVLSHHEKYDGTGYPNKLKGRKIPMLSRIISVADVYDALTSNRPYRTPMQPPEAIEYIMGNVSTAFDFEVVKAFLRKVELYPVGNFVELSNQQIAVVLSNENPMRPVVKTLDGGQILDLYWDRSCLSLTIKRFFRNLEEAGGA
jgi:HD-GYP domain-containing protein (c-di-GMP phosphodiesterase class II)